MRELLISVGDASQGDLRHGYLSRLQRLLDLRRNYEPQLNEQGMHLLNRSIFAAYCDCLDVGAELPARDLLRAAEFRLPGGEPQALA